MNQYAAEHNRQYDAVIRLRFDIAILSPLHVEKLNLKLINYHNLHQPDDIISDWINIGSPHIMNVYSHTFLHLKQLNKLTHAERSAPVTFRGCKNNLWGNEYFIREEMSRNNIEKNMITKTDIVIVYN
jgi:hypothetical protein